MKYQLKENKIVKVEEGKKFIEYSINDIENLIKRDSLLRTNLNKLKDKVQNIADEREKLELSSLTKYGRDERFDGWFQSNNNVNYPVNAPELKKVAELSKKFSKAVSDEANYLSDILPELDEINSILTNIRIEHIKNGSLSKNMLDVNLYSDWFKKIK